jgi:hypothetical protein
VPAVLVLDVQRVLLVPKVLPVPKVVVLNVLQALTVLRATSPGDRTGATRPVRFYRTAASSRQPNARADVAVDEVHDVLHRRARQEYAPDADFIELGNIDVWDDAADDD